MTRAASPDLPAALRAALEARLQGVSRNEAAERAAAISKTYRDGGGSTAIASETDALAYALARMPATYAADIASLNALLDIRPDFAPSSLLDVGAGPGTATWAAAEAFPSLQSLALLDANDALRALALDLAREGGRQIAYERGEAHALLAKAESADLVVASYVIGEMNEAERRSLATLMWEKTRDIVREQGGEVQMRSPVVRVNRSGSRVTSVDVKRWSTDGSAPVEERISGDHFINTMALRDLIHAFDPPPPPEVVEAANKLKYRDFLIVTLVLDHADPFKDNWIYIHSPKVQVGRIQNFRAWSKEMLPDQNTASIGMEYFCQEGDGLWEMKDEDLRNLAAKELETLGLAKATDVIGAAIIRQPKAYPVYDGEYREALDVLEEWLLSLENFQTVGRNGLHRYNNQDHSMLSAMYAARNILGEHNDVWNVNVERSYHEEFEVKKDGQGEPLAAE